MASLAKLYSRIFFKNSPSQKTPLNEANLNKMDKAINDLDDRVVDVNEQLGVERERINNMARLPEGSTTGDAELIDGRTDYKGTTHTNIGAHIRDVSSQLSSEIINQLNIYHTFDKTELIRGDIINGDGNSYGIDFTRTTRTTTQEIYRLPIIVKKLKDDVKVSLRYRDDGKFYKKDFSDWLDNNSYIVCADGRKYVSFTIAYTDDREITESDFEYLAGAVAFYSASNDEDLKSELFAYQSGTATEDGSTYFNSNRITTKFINMEDHVRDFAIIDLPIGYSYKPVFYKTKQGLADDAYKGFGEFSTSNMFQIWSPYMRIVLKKIDDGSISLDEGKQIRINFDEKSKYKSRINQVNSNKVHDGYGIVMNDGNAIFKTESKVTEMIELPYHNPYNNYIYDSFPLVHIACELNGQYGYGCNIVAFYDENKNIISKVDNIISFVELPKNAKFMCIEFDKSATKLFASFGIIEKLPQYVEYREELPYEIMPSIAHTISNSDGAITNLLRTAMQYAYNAEFGYGNTNTAFHDECGKMLSNGTISNGLSTPVYEGERYQIDCSAFNNLVLQGITPKNSRHMTDDNYVSQSGYLFDGDAEYDTKYGRMMANELAKYAFKKGYLYEVNDDLSNVRVGDLLFWCNQPPSYGSWKNIGHCGLVTDTWQVKKGATIRCRTLESHSTTEYVVEKGNVTKTKDDTVRYGARFPLPFASVDTTPINVVDTSKTVNLALTANNKGLLSKIQMEEPLTTAEVYTVIFEADIPDTAHLLITVNDGENILNPYGWEIKPPSDGKYKIPCLLHQNIVLKNPLQMELYVKAQTATNSTVTISNVKIVRGFMR